MVNQHLNGRRSGRLALAALVVLLASASASLATEPQSGDTVSGSGFDVTFTSVADPYVGIQQAGGTWYGGTYVSGPPDWDIHFHGIPAGTGYTITIVVWDNGSPQYTYITNITVQ
jgi:uncharacterized membrane protein